MASRAAPRNSLEDLSSPGLNAMSPVIGTKAHSPPSSDVDASSSHHVRKEVLGHSASGGGGVRAFIDKRSIRSRENILFKSMSERKIAVYFEKTTRSDAPFRV